MLLHRFALLIAMVYLGPGPGGDRSASLAHPCRSDPVAVERGPCSSLVPIPPGHTGLSRLPSWRHRIKSVLEDKVAWCPRAADLGPADVPESIERGIGPPSNAVRRNSLIPLRC
jgi:hypothetical protein